VYLSRVSDQTEAGADKSARPPKGAALRARAPEGALRRALWIAVVAGAACLGSGLATCAYRGLAFRPDAPLTSTTTVVRGSSAVVTAIRDLATLETASYHMERVIDLRDKQAHLFGLFESEDAVLLVAAADVVAGIDLRSMRDGDIVFDSVRHTAHVTLPPPQILSAHLDNAQTYVHTRATDTLARRAETLETRARAEAELTLREAALEAGILARARSNGARTIQTLVQSLGFSQVEVVFRSE
jgi:hypothetical protein